jgi:carbonic anhydrase
MIDHLFEGNEKFRKNDFQKNIDFYHGLVESQKPTVLWLGCSDSRVNPERITSSCPGKIFVQRNIGNIVPSQDWNFATVLEYAINHLHVTDIVICGHSGCGAMRALDAKTDDVYIPLWLNNAQDAKRRVDEGVNPPVTENDKKERFKKIEHENVRLQLEHIMTYPLVKKAVEGKKIRLHGLYYDLESGALSNIS